MAVLAALAVLVVALVWSQSASRDARSPACRPGQVRAALGPQVVPFTGEHAVLVVLSAVSAGCVIEGYPQVTLSDRTHVLRFRVKDGGGPYVTPARPKPVSLRRGHNGYVLVAKYRCDGPAGAAATRVTLSLPGRGGEVSVSLPDEGVGGLDYCPPYSGGPTVDPGDTVVVSPVAARGTKLY